MKMRWGKDLCNRFPVTMDGKQGYIDRSGRLVIEPTFDHADTFSYGLASVIVGRRWGYIDYSGNYVVEPQYDECGRMEDGMGHIWLNGRWGLINRHGKVVVPPKYTSVGTLSEGMFSFQVGGRELWKDSGFHGGKKGLMNRAGKIVVRPRFAAIRVFRRGRARVNTGGKPDLKTGFIEGGKWGTIDKTGRYLVKPTADAPENKLGQQESGQKPVKWDSPADTYVPWRKFGKPSEGMTAIKNKMGKYGFIDRSGKVVIEPVFDGVGWFSEGRVSVSVGGFSDSSAQPPFGKTAFIDRTGKFITQPKYDRASEFFDGLAEVRIGCRLDCRDREPWQVWWPTHLSDGLIGYIDRNGKEVWKPTA